MHRESVDSSSLSGVGYDSSSRTLEIEFVSGRIYRYQGVPQGIYSALLEAPSKGQFFNREIRDRFPYSRRA
ncbi:MAG TPA: KTSC domain-containing protein [Thermoanaerobaculia bacterium]|jgi:hypothetical protein|nr:KTSC domain-containing protein [Thermoanaerobaculia bacterium]